MKIIVVASLAYSLVNFRGALLQRLVREGFDVVACAPDRDLAIIETLTGWGVRFVTVPMDRAGQNPLADAATLTSLCLLFRRERPDLVLAYTQKPIIYAGLATRIIGGIDFFAMVSGLGHAFGSASSAWRRALRTLVSLMYRQAVARARCIFVFNRDDAGELRRHAIVSHQALVEVPGSGVDVSHFASRAIPDRPFTFVMVARLMREKGLEEFVEASRLVRQKWPGARCQIIGPLDANPTGLNRVDIARWEAGGTIEYLGETRDVRPPLANAHVFVLPSYYREGLPRSILEAMATGRAVITTDTPGCRDAVIDGETGFIVPPRDAGALAEAMLRFRRDATLAARMGRAGRARAESIYAVDLVNDRLLDAISRYASVQRAETFSRQRLAERAIAALALLALSPLMAGVALIILVSMGQPILFKQERVGLNTVPFLLRKFRTMHQIADPSGRPLPDAARLTTVGRVLRRTRLDELPQLFAVVRGEMSIVGPRPLLPETVAAMGEAGRARSAVRPGLTGWAQINGNALLTDADKLALDRWYIAHRSLRLDLAIIWRTVGMVLFGERVRLETIERAYASVADRGS